MARHGLILSQDGATSLRNVFKYLPGLRDTILRPKMIKKTKSKHPINPHIFEYGVPSLLSANGWDYLYVPALSFFESFVCSAAVAAF